MSTVSQAITAVYVGMYNRAADQSGYNFWLSNFGGNPDALVTAEQMSQLAREFSNNSYFTTAYPPSMSGSDFINQLYLNIGGNGGDRDGLSYWQSRLVELGNDRSEMVAEFIHGFISIDLSSKPAGLTDAEYQQAIQRQDSLLNKVEVSEVFRDTLGEGSNLSVNDPALFDSDPAFILSRTIISGVDYNASSKDLAVAEIQDLAANQPGVGIPDKGEGPNDVDNDPNDLFILRDGQADTVELSMSNRQFLIENFEPELDRFTLSSDLKALIGSIEYTGEVSSYESLETPEYFTGVAGQAAIVKNTGMHFIDNMMTGVSQLVIDTNGDGLYEIADGDMAISLVGVWQLEDYNFV